MQEQNFKNHSRMVPLFHYVAFSSVLIALITALIHLYYSLNSGTDILLSIGFLCLTFAVILALWFARAFALKAQDRAIRAEENLRYFAVTGKLLSNKLKISQIVALRFAGDNEYIDLVQKTIDENLSSKDIKASITNWRADYNRV